MEGIDREAFQRLAEQHRARAVRFAARFMGDAGMAEDMVQEGLGRLYERRDDYPLHTHFGPYLVKTVARLCLDERRDRRSEPLRQNALLRLARVPESPSLPMERREARDRVAGAMGALPERERACLLLAACENLSYREIGETLSLSFAEVNNAIHRARLSLRDTLGDLA